MDFVTAVKTCLGKYATFQGRARRAEYWYFMLFVVLLNIIVGIIDSALPPEVPVVEAVAIALLIPALAVTVRRLHDKDKSGWWYLIILIPLLGSLLLLFWTVTRGTEGANRFGDDPLGETTPAAIAA